MKTMKHILVLMFLIPISLFGQEKGSIRGQVFDQEYGQTILGAKIRVVGQPAGGMSDLDGKFNISMNPGVYELRLTFTGKDTMLINDVKVTANDNG